MDASLTNSQRDALQRIKAIRDIQVERLESVAREMGGVPSRWVIVATLVNVHRIPSRMIAALVRKGYAQQRPTNGFGPEILV